MNQIQQSAEKLLVRIKALDTLAQNYGARIPDEIGSVSVGTDKAVISFSTGYSDADRNSVLTLLGNIFGTDGWTKTLSYGRESYHWSKQVDGVQLFIANAEVIPPPVDKIPVSPKAFPLMLQEAVA